MSCVIGIPTARDILHLSHIDFPTQSAGQFVARLALLPYLMQAL